MLLRCVVRIYPAHLLPSDRRCIGRDLPLRNKNPRLSLPTLMTCSVRKSQIVPLTEGRKAKRGMNGDSGDAGSD